MTAADGLRRLTIVDDLASSARRIVVALLLIGVYTLAVYATGCHNGADAENAASELHRADSARVAAIQLAHAASVRVAAAKHVVVEQKADAAPAIARSDSLRQVVRAVDETTLAVVRSLGMPPLVAVVPPEVVEERAADSSAIAHLTVVVAVQDTLIAVQDDRHTADSVALGAANHEIDVIKKQKQPRCGKKCGIAIGVVATVGTVFLAGRAADVVRYFLKRPKPP